jgi:DNA-binding transcriptional LysR family regulator
LNFERHIANIQKPLFKIEDPMGWDDFKYFLAVVRGGSLTAAAHALKTSPATVGRRIAALETSLGARLFDRHQTGYVLTESGEAIRHRSEQIEEAVLAVEREAHGRDLRLTGRVRVATAEDIAAFIIAPKLAALRRAHPGIVLEIVASWDVANLTRREADIAIRTVRPTHGDYVIQQIGIWKCALFASKGYVAENQLKPGLRNLRGMNMISWTEESSFRGGEFFAQNARGASTAIAASSRHIQYAACKAGLGLAVLPCVAAGDDPDLVQLLPPERVRCVPMWLVVHQDLARTARVRAVMNYLATIMPKA